MRHLTAQRIELLPAWRAFVIYRRSHTVPVVASCAYHLSNPRHCQGVAELL
jgi:hypothetical protein